MEAKDGRASRFYIVAHNNVPRSRKFGLIVRCCQRIAALSNEPIVSLTHECLLFAILLFSLLLAVCACRTMFTIASQQQGAKPWDLTLNFLVFIQGGRQAGFDGGFTQ